MDRTMSDVLLAVGRGATTTRGILDATGLSRLKCERSLHALEKQMLLIRDGQSFRSARAAPPVPVRQCGSCNMCCDVLEVTAVGKPVNQLCRHWAAGTGCTIYAARPQMCRSFNC